MEDIEASNIKRKEPNKSIDPSIYASLCTVIVKKYLCARTSGDSLTICKCP